MRQTVRSIFWKIFSCGCFALINVIVRYLTGGSPIPLTHSLPSFVIMFFQYLIGAITFLPWILRTNTRIQFGRYPAMNFARILIATISIGIWYLSLSYMPITEVVGLGFISPIITIIAAIIFLHEKLTLNKTFAIMLTLVGSFFMLRPDQSFGTIGQYGIYALLPITAAAFFAFDKILVRKLLSRGESAELLSIYLLIFIAPMCLLPALFSGWSWPHFIHLPWLLLLGVLSALANFAFNKAYELAEVTFLMPFGLAKILISGLLSYLAFAEFPRSMDIWLGIVIIGMSAILLNRDRVKKIV